MSKYLKSLFYNVLGKDGIIGDDVGRRSGFNKVRNDVGNSVIELDAIMEDTGTNNQVAPSHGAPIGYFIIAVEGGGIS